MSYREVSPEERIQILTAEIERLEGELKALKTSLVPKWEYLWGNMHPNPNSHLVITDSEGIKQVDFIKAGNEGWEYIGETHNNKFVFKRRIV